MGYSINGAVGYRNRLVLNGFLQPGKNKIEVVFEPTPDLEGVREQGEKAEAQAIRDMYAHAVITRGILSDSGSAVESYDLDRLILSNQRKVEILENKLLRRFNKEIISKEVSVVYEFDLAKDEVAVKASAAQCSLSLDSLNEEGYFSGEIYLNDVLLRTINGSSSTQKESFFEQLKPGKNIFKLKISEMHKTKMGNIQGVLNTLKNIFSKPSIKTQRLKLRMDCDVDQAAQKVKFPEEYGRMRFGDFFDVVYVDLAEIEYSNVGEYQAEFEFSE